MNGNRTLKLTVVSLLSWFLTAATLHLQEGRYEVTVTYEVQHERQNQSRTSARCIRSLDLESPERVFNDAPASSTKPEESCTVKDFKSGSGTVSYDADCSNRTVHVEGELSNAGFDVVRIVTPKASTGVSLKFTVRGKRLGDCATTGAD